MDRGEHIQKYPGGVLRGVNVQDGGYALWTPHYGCQFEITGDLQDSPTQRHVLVRSPLYGDHLFSPELSLGDFKAFGSVINRAVRTPLFERALDISQLTKLQSSATIANTQDFYRAQTLELVMVYAQVIEKAKAIELSEEDIYEQVINQLYEDLLHFMLSHGLEIHFKGWNSDQTASTKMGGLVIPAAMPDLIDTPDMRSLSLANGTFGLSKDFDFISAKRPEDGSAPGLDFDKFHYTMTEAALWFADYDDPQLHELIIRASRPDAVDISSDGQLYFKDAEVALFFSKAYLLLSTEHWNDVMQRLQIFAGNQAYSLAVIHRRLRSMFDADGHPIDSGETMNPECYAYGVDSDLDAALAEMVQEGDEYAYILQELLKTVGMQERNRFMGNKRRIYAEFLKDMHAVDYPNSSGILGKNKGYNRDFGLESFMFEIKVMEHTDKTNKMGVLPILTNRSSRFGLDTLKVRSIDPLVRTSNGTLMKLTEYLPRYKTILDQHEIVHNTPLSISLMLNRNYIGMMKRGYQDTQRQFGELMRRPHLSTDKMRPLILGAAKRAKSIAKKRGVLVEK